jgi:biopolymer transport protein ExbB
MTTSHVSLHRYWRMLIAAAILSAPLYFISTPGVGQDTASDAAANEADAALAGAENPPADQGEGGAGGDAPAEMDMLELIFQGGLIMVPIGFMLVMVITFTIERALGLRRSKILPEELTQDFGRLSSASGGFDPRRAYRICQTYPCAAANVIRSMLLKIGRPHSEVEHAVNEAIDREAAGLYSNVRWLNLAAAVTPLLGLFGTVWGMIIAFNATATIGPDQSKSTVLAAGIVKALMTTFGGLFVAIPAAIAAHFFEGRIQALFREIDELLFSMLPQVERYEGKLRVSREQLGATEKTEKPTKPDERSEPVLATASDAPSTK